MPVRDKLNIVGVAGEEDLVRELETELRTPKDSGGPLFIIERPHPRTIHLFVIWSKWQDLEQVVRSRMILDVYRLVKGETDASDITVAMDLTPTEANRLGIH